MRDFCIWDGGHLGMAMMEIARFAGHGVTVTAPDDGVLLVRWDGGRQLPIANGQALCRDVDRWWVEDAPDKAVIEEVERMRTTMSWHLDRAIEEMVAALGPVRAALVKRRYPVGRYRVVDLQDRAWEFSWPEGGLVWQRVE